MLCENEIVNMPDALYYGQNQGTKAPVIDSSSGKITLVDVEREHIENALRHFNFRTNKTTELLGIGRKTLRIKIRNYGIEE